MRSEDLAQVLQIERNTQRVPWSRLAFEESLTRSETDQMAPYHCQVFCPEESEQIVAFFIVAQVLDELHIMNLAVATQAQGRGYGHLILKRITELANQLQSKKVFLEVRASNTVAISLYEKWNFQQIGTRPNYYRTEQASSFEDALIYCHQLTKIVSA